MAKKTFNSIIIIRPKRCQGTNTRTHKYTAQVFVCPWFNGTALVPIRHSSTIVVVKCLHRISASNEEFADNIPSSLLANASVLVTYHRSQCSLRSADVKCITVENCWHYLRLHPRLPTPAAIITFATAPHDRSRYVKAY